MNSFEYEVICIWFFRLYSIGGAIAFGILFLTYSLYKSTNKEVLQRISAIERKYMFESRPTSKATILTTDMWIVSIFFLSSRTFFQNETEEIRSDAKHFYILFTIYFDIYYNILIDFLNLWIIFIMFTKQQIIFLLYVFFKMHLIWYD